MRWMPRSVPMKMVIRCDLVCVAAAPQVAAHMDALQHAPE
jgi:hypothetical protein